MQIYIVRHGQTEYNIGEPRFRGQLEIPLSEFGIKQADSISRALKPVPLDIIYYSKLQRAKDTAEKIKKYHRNTQFIEEPLLLTLNFGDWQGKLHSEVLNEEERQIWKNNPNSLVIPNGETFYDVLSRVHRLFIRLRHQNENDIALITHRVVIIMILLYLFKLDPSHFWDFKVDTASITHIEYFPNNSFKLIKLNDITHLKQL